LKVFWTTHDPTTLNRQGADVGTQYRSAIFYTSDAQRETAEKSKAEFAPTLWDDKIVTEITKAEPFYVAEDYHQNYYNENPNAGYCRVVINPKVRKLREKFGDLLKDN
jgi:peptide-methionine (S)-S-oxide reductase